MVDGMAEKRDGEEGQDMDKKSRNVLESNLLWVLGGSRTGKGRASSVKGPR